LNQQKCTRRRDIKASSTKVCRAVFARSPEWQTPRTMRLFRAAPKRRKIFSTTLQGVGVIPANSIKSCLLSKDYGTTRWPVDRLALVDALQGKSGDF
jgi:hypothetical protein